MNFRLALITGASSGLGKALAIALSHKNISLILSGRDAKALEVLASQLSVAAMTHRADLTNVQERQGLLKLIRQERPDLVINSAGFGLYGPAIAHPTVDQSAMVEVNVQALVEITLESARALLQHREQGTILNVSSAAAFFTYPTFSIYAASKTFVNQFSEAMDFELSKHGIRVLTTCPGQIETAFRARASGHFLQTKDRLWTMSAQKAAQLILKQIEQGKRLSIIDWRYALLVKLSRLLPKRLLSILLNKSLVHRHNVRLEI